MKHYFLSVLYGIIFVMCAHTTAFLSAFFTMFHGAPPCHIEKKLRQIVMMKVYDNIIAYPYILEVYIYTKRYNVL